MSVPEGVNAMVTENRSREDVLERIRAANRGVARGGSAVSEWAAIPRGYRCAAGSDGEAVIALLEDRLRDYDALTWRSTRMEVAEAIGGRLAERGDPRMIVPMGFPQEMLPSTGRFTVDDGFTAAELDGFEGVLTTATMAIAETGTLVLQNVAGQGRRAATLVPDYHLCVVDMRDVVLSVPAAIERLAPTSTLPTTFVSGPSATADIEMTRIKGVHGPRFLEVILFS